jgi:hypothetical protein
MSKTLVLLVAIVCLVAVAETVSASSTVGQWVRGGCGGLWLGVETSPEGVWVFHGGGKNIGRRRCSFEVPGQPALRPAPPPLPLHLAGSYRARWVK